MSNHHPNHDAECSFYLPKFSLTLFKSILISIENYSSDFCHYRLFCLFLHVIHVESYHRKSFVSALFFSAYKTACVLDSYSQCCIYISLIFIARGVFHSMDVLHSFSHWTIYLSSGLEIMNKVFLILLWDVCGLIFLFMLDKCLQKKLV